MNRRIFLRQTAAAGLVAAAHAAGVAAEPPPPAGADGEAMPGERSGRAPPVWSLADSLRLACAWITDVAQIKTERLTIERDSLHHAHTSWRGAIRGEYSADRREWDFFGPVWHTAQAVKALALAAHALADPGLLASARFSAEFIGTARISNRDDPDFGLLLAYEDRGDVVNTSGVLEACDGLLALSDATGDPRYAAWAEAAVAWVADRAYLGGGLFRDAYFPGGRRWVRAPWLEDRPGVKGNRPLLDGGIFLRIARRTGERRYRNIFFETAERLLADEDPPGNWIRYPPCDPARGTLHPRQAYWWGRPFVAAYGETRDPRYLDCAKRSGEWYLGAMRTDGGLFRDTRRDFKTPSFGHETSGICCAMLLWQDLAQATDAAPWSGGIRQALRYCRKAQFRRVRDPNLHGAILDRVRPPDGTDGSPYHLRDLGTIFYVQAVSRLMTSGFPLGRA